MCENVPIYSFTIERKKKKKLAIRRYKKNPSRDVTPTIIIITTRAVKTDVQPLTGNQSYNIKNIILT